jgi:hypothetical protein
MFAEFYVRNGLNVHFVIAVTLFITLWPNWAVEKAITLDRYLLQLNTTNPEIGDASNAAELYISLSV